MIDFDPISAEAARMAIDRGVYGKPEHARIEFALRGGVVVSAAPLVKDKPFIQQSELTGRWWFVQSWRPEGEMRVAHVKWDISDAIEKIIEEARK